MREGFVEVELGGEWGAIECKVKEGRMEERKKERKKQTNKQTNRQTDKAESGLAL